MIISVGDGVLLKSKNPKVFPETTLDEAAGCLNYQGKAKTIEEMEEAISSGIKQLWNDNK